MKKFIAYSLFFAIPFYLVLGYCFFIFRNGMLTGDIGWTGAIPFGKKYEMKFVPLYPKENKTVNYSNSTDLTRFKYLTFGDSFSQAAIIGYQNYFSQLVGDSVLNIRFGVEGSEMTALRFLNAGLLNPKKVKLVVVETVERKFIATLSGLNFEANSIENKKPSNYKCLNIDTLGKHPVTLDKVFQWVRNSVGLGEKLVLKTDLDFEAFTHKSRSKELHFLAEDISFNKYTDEQILQAKKNLIRLHELFAQKGIRFVYMVAADKYDVYYHHILNNPYPRNPILDSFKDFSKEDWFMNTNEILRKQIDSGTKDLYKINDTHWSYLGHKLIAEEIYKRLQ
jgi:hypothetical protein